jgi:nicotinate dehydrogenase subunit B
MATLAPEPTATLPANLRANRRLDRWLRVDPAGFVEVRSGKVEIGQGILTALAQIAAAELGLRVDQVRMRAATTAASPDEAVTSGSLSIQDSGSALRVACAEARALYRGRAASVFGLDANAITIADGEFVAPDGRRTTYWALADDALLAREALGNVLPRENGLISASVGRLDIPDKVFGVPTFIHDLEWPEMLHGRIVRPTAGGATLAGLADAALAQIDGTIVRDGSLVGVLAATSALADRAAAKVATAARWNPGFVLPANEPLDAWLRAQPVDTELVDRRVGAIERSSVRTLRATYEKPFLAHASIAPSCALARWHGTDGQLDVWTHSQGIYNLRRDLALAFGIAESAVDVHHVQGAGCYGHNGADDVAFDAAWLARSAPGRFVRVLWSRPDELGCSPVGPAMSVTVEADLDEHDRIVAWRHDVWSNGHGTRPGRGKSPALLGAWSLAEPFERPIAVDAARAVGGGTERNAVPLYDFPSWEIVKHRVLAMPIRTSAMRALGAVANVFAIESFVDEIAQTIGVDPVAFRLRHLSDPRARVVIERAVSAAGDRLSGEGAGRGIGFAKYKNTGAYCAVVADVEALQRVFVRRLTIAVDVGIAINPDGVANQVEGGAIQATSWALKETVAFDAERITSTDWESYPILRFSEVPEVGVECVASKEPSVGAGECSLGPTVAAIGNALFDALGVRVRRMPFTTEHVVEAAEESS